MNKQNSELDRILYEGLNEHGFLFQEKCAEFLSANQIKTDWLLLTKEYPISTKYRDTRIDFILKDIKGYSEPLDVYAIVECKRVNLDYHMVGYLVSHYYQVSINHWLYPCAKKNFLNLVDMSASISNITN